MAHAVNIVVIATDLSENTETIADLFSTSSPNIGDIARHLSWKHSTHGVAR